MIRKEYGFVVRTSRAGDKTIEITPMNKQRLAIRIGRVFRLTCLVALLTTWQGCQSASPSSTVENVAQVENNTMHDEACQTTPNRETLAANASNSNASDANVSVDTLPRMNQSANTNGMVLIPGGMFQMGTNDGMPYEAPMHEVVLKSFYIDATEVTVAEFARFVEATGYVTEAERFGWSGVFDVKQATWTRGDGATWRTPDGAGSTAKPNEPVTQVSWNDAGEYAKWAGKRLPSEAEFEYAARGGLKGKEYAWGDELRPQGKPVANWWQGTFPARNTGEDGFIGRAQVGGFAANGYGLYDVAGNVWEWTADWYADDYYQTSPRDNPTGASVGTERVIRGGSWLCAENYCTNYRVAGRSHATPDSGLNNLGFRCVRDVIR
ncbi:MAG: formylglycine-generating enzyme family protein [Pyrinomonadaceae bacterium MAG19_C2-C3]|nr:formylglycine-generating enzyme family protein [Pyrinomonadaceae bacterium MAG19_C2-C3]